MCQALAVCHNFSSDEGLGKCQPFSFCYDCNSDQPLSTWNYWANLDSMFIFLIGLNDVYITKLQNTAWKTKQWQKPVVQLKLKFITRDYATK